MIAWVVTMMLVSAAFLILVPRSMLRGVGRVEKRLLGWFLLARATTPMVFEYITNRTDRFFEGGSDSIAYHKSGIRVVEDLDRLGRSLSHNSVPGTGAIELGTGYFYRLVGDTIRMTAVYASATVSTIGILLFWLATRDLVTRHRERYTAALFFAPTLLFWNSSLGKEAPIMFGIGALVLSLRFLLMSQRLHLAAFYGLLGLLFSGYVRPHVTGAFLGAAAVGSMVARTRVRRLERGSGRLLVFAAAGVSLVFTLSLSGELLQTGEDQSLIDAAYDAAESRSSGQGRASYELEPVRSPVQVPIAVVTVLFRPFPWEVRTFLQGLTAIESLVLFGLLAKVANDIASRVSRLDRSVIAVTSMLFVAVLSSAVASYGNFGLLARQRMQVWPFIILIAFLPQQMERRPSATDRAEALSTRSRVASLPR